VVVRTYKTKYIYETVKFTKNAVQYIERFTFYTFYLYILQIGLNFQKNSILEKKLNVTEIET